jgi:hypothetical protein
MNNKRKMKKKKKDLILKTPITKVGWWSGLRCRLEPQYCQKKP